MGEKTLIGKALKRTFYKWRQAQRQLKASQRSLFIHPFRTNPGVLIAATVT